MSQFQQFDISDFFNELQEPVLLMDSSEVLFFNRWYKENYQEIPDDWKAYFNSPKIQEELVQFFENGKSPTSKYHQSLKSRTGDEVSIEWSFINLPTSYSSRFLIAKGQKLENQPAVQKESLDTPFFHSILNNSHDLIAILDQDGNYKYISESITEKLGFAPKDIIGKNFREFISNDIIQVVKGDFVKILETKEEIAIDFWVKLPTGKKMLLESFAKNLLDHPQIKGILFSSRDITEYVETENSLRRRYEIENLINQISTRLIRGSLIDLEEQFEYVLAKFGEFFKAQSAKISIINRDTKQLEIISLWSNEHSAFESFDIGPRYFSLVNSILKDLEKSQVRIVSAPTKFGLSDPSHKTEFIFAPMLTAEDKMLGIIEFEVVDPSFPLLEQELQILRQLGDILAGAYIGSLMTRKLERNENLLATTELLSMSGSWRYSAVSNKFYFSDGFSNLLGLGNQVKTMESRALIYKIDKPFRLGFIQNLKKASTELCRTSGEFSISDKTGKIRHFSYEIEGKKEFMSKGMEVFGFCTDITQKINSENYLRLQSQILAQVADPILVTNQQLEVLYLNEAAVQLCCPETAKDFKGPIEELVNFYWEAGENLAKFVENLQVGEFWVKERDIQTLHTSKSPFEVSVQAIHADGDEKVGYSMILRGLAEKYKNEELAQRAQHIVENSPAVLFRINPSKNHKIKYISQNVKQFGYSAEDLIARGVSFADLVFEEDLEKILKVLKPNENGHYKDTFSGEYRFRKADGTWIWVQDNARAVWDDENGNYIHEGIFQDISDRKNLELIKANRDHQYRMLASNIPNTNIFLVDRDRRYIVAEGTNFEKWGFKREDFEGKYLRDLQLTDYEEVNEILNRVFENQEIIESEFFLKGRYYQRIIRPIIENSQAIFALSIVRDIHEEYQAKMDLQQSEEKYRRLVEESTEIIFSLSETYLLHYVSPNVSQFLGYESREVIGKSIFDFIHLDDLGVFQEMLSETKDFLAHNQYLEFRLRHKNGEYRVFNSNGKLMVDKDGIHRYYTGVARDISKLKEAQRELVIAKEKAEQASLVKSQFLSVMSHEIRTPMNAVIGLAHFLMEENPRPDQLENLKTLQFSAENLMALINDILDYNKIDSGKVELEKTPFDIRNLVHRIIHSHSFLANEKGLKLQFQIDETIPELLIGDSLRLGQVLNNLISNAIKFTEKGQVKISISREYTQDQTTEIRFEFEDSGIGIPEAKRKVIFEAFTQASSSTSRKYGGTGLGLAIVKRLVELFGGDITVRPRPGGGSIFEFSLAFEFVKEQKGSADSSQKLLARSLDNVSILVAEDNAVNQILIKKFLTKWNVANIEIASDGLEALEAFKRGTFDLVLLDLQMPELDGFEVAKVIRSLEDPVKKNIPIIALTAASLHEVKSELLEIGIDDFVPKPFTPEGLYEKIIKYLQGKEPA